MARSSRHWVASSAALLFLASLSPGWTAAQGPSKEVRTREIERLAAELKQRDPWPAIRREWIEKLLPVAMDAAKVDGWVIFCRENHSDPLARHVGGEHAGRLTTFVFTRAPGGVESHVIAPPTEVITLGERLTHARVVAAGAGQSAFQLVAAYLRGKSPAAIAINKSELTVADGFTLLSTNNSLLLSGQTSRGDSRLPKSSCIAGWG